MNDDQPTAPFPHFTPDHDVLIELRTEMRGMRSDLKSFSDDTRDRLTRLEENKLDKLTFTEFQGQMKTILDDHERRIRFIERWGWSLWGAIVIVEFGIVIYVTYFSK